MFCLLGILDVRHGDNNDLARDSMALVPRVVRDV